jgi:hypothetical protein
VGPGPFCIFTRILPGCFADVGFGNNFERYPGNTKKDRRALLRAIDRALDA